MVAIHKGYAASPGLKFFWDRGATNMSRRWRWGLARRPNSHLPPAHIISLRWGRVWQSILMTGQNATGQPNQITTKNTHQNII